eukprot:7377470-Prymnesium_polylepis.5
MAQLRRVADKVGAVRCFYAVRLDVLRCWLPLLVRPLLWIVRCLSPPPDSNSMVAACELGTCNRLVAALHLLVDAGAVGNLERLPDPEASIGAILRRQPHARLQPASQAMALFLCHSASLSDACRICPSYLLLLPLVLRVIADAAAGDDQVRVGCASTAASRPAAGGAPVTVLAPRNHT